MADVYARAGRVYSPRGHHILTLARDVCIGDTYEAGLAVAPDGTPIGMDTAVTGSMYGFWHYGSDFKQ